MSNSDFTRWVRKIYGVEEEDQSNFILQKVLFVIAKTKEKKRMMKSSQERLVTVYETES